MDRGERTSLLLMFTRRVGRVAAASVWERELHTVRNNHPEAEGHDVEYTISSKKEKNGYPVPKVKATWERCGDKV